MVELGTLLSSLIVVQLISLFFFSRMLIRSLSRMFHLLTHSQTKTISLLAALFLPGTVIHELAHVIVAGVLMVPTGNIEFIPEIREDGVKLGSAQIGKTDPFRRMLIGVAPFLAGTSLIIGAIFYFTYVLPQYSPLNLGSVLVLLYIVFEIGNTMFSSNKDMEGAIEVLLIIVAIFVGTYFLGFYKPYGVAEKIYSQPVIDFLIKANLFLMIPIITDILIYGLVRFGMRRHN